MGENIKREDEYMLLQTTQKAFNNMEQESFQSSSKMAALVQSHCEFLTCLRHNVSQRTEIARGSFKTLQEYMKDRRCKMNNESISQLVIELAYFFYACKNYQITPVIDTVEDVRVEESSIRNSQKRFSIIVWYKVRPGTMMDGETMHNYIILFRTLESQLKDYLRQRKEQRDKTPQDLEYQHAFDIFRGQFDQLAENKYFQNHQPQFFLCLEQTALFYQYSILYRIKNCSMMDFIKTDEKRLELFRVAKVKDESLVIEYNKQKSRGKSEQQVLRTKQRDIETNISQFFKTINEKNYFEIQAKNEKDQTYRVKFNYTLRERQKYAFQQMIQTMQGANIFRNDSKKLMECRRPLSEIEYFIEYSSEKNHICVKLYNPTLVANVQTSDFLIFQSNVLTFDPVNVSIELTEPPRLRGVQKNNKKVITFKGSSSFNVKQPPLQKILLLMDITMIASKIYEPELNPNRYGSTTKDYQRLSIISKKISHYTKLYLKCAKKIYYQ